MNEVFTKVSDFLKQDIKCMIMLSLDFERQNPNFYFEDYDGKIVRNYHQHKQNKKLFHSEVLRIAIKNNLMRHLILSSNN